MDLHWIPSVKFQSLAANFMSGVFSYIVLWPYGHLSDPIGSYNRIGRPGLMYISIQEQIPHIYFNTGMKVYQMYTVEIKRNNLSFFNIITFS
jgi:hypothetical protein